MENENTLCCSLYFLIRALLQVTSGSKMTFRRNSFEFASTFSPSHVFFHSLVPVFVDKCISYMEANGLYQEGIYRRSGAAVQNRLLVEALDKDIECQKVG